MANWLYLNNTGAFIYNYQLDYDPIIGKHHHQAVILIYPVREQKCLIVNSELEWVSFGMIIKNMDEATACILVLHGKLLHRLPDELTNTTPYSGGFCYNLSDEFISSIQRNK